MQHCKRAVFLFYFIFSGLLDSILLMQLQEAYANVKMLKNLDFFYLNLHFYAIFFFFFDTFGRNQTFESEGLSHTETQLSSFNNILFIEPFSLSIENKPLVSHQRLRMYLSQAPHTFCVTHDPKLIIGSIHMPFIQYLYILCNQYIVSFREIHI